MRNRVPKPRAFLAAVLLLSAVLLNGCVAVPPDLPPKITGTEASASPTLPDRAVPAPTEPPTEAPTELPTETPTETPTDAPTEPPTEPPTAAPTEPPTEPTLPERQTPETPEPSETPEASEPPDAPAARYVVNVSTKKFHFPDCSSVKSMKEDNRMDFCGPRDELIAQGYEPCKRCNP